MEAVVRRRVAAQVGVEDSGAERVEVCTERELDGQLECSAIHVRWALLTG